MSEFDTRGKEPFTNPETPICPYCNKEILTAVERHMGVREKVFYLCPKCHKVLSIGKA